MKTEQATFKVGQLVQVSNGQPKPPARFTRKLADWNLDNYKAEVTEIESPTYDDNTRLILAKLSHKDNSALCFRYVVVVGRRLTITPLECEDEANQ